jgi:hypothetical protein
MTTSSSDRCTRISPSAVLDDRLDGKDLEWARDHLRRCEACRERVEDFREMLLRVGRLPKATLGATAMDEAYTMAVPERLREEAGFRGYEISSADSGRLVPPMGSLPSAIHPEVTSVPDLMSELEREIFRDEPVPGHPSSLAAMPEPIYPTMAPPEEPAAGPPPTDEVVAEPDTADLREVPLDSHREPEPSTAPPPAPAPAPAASRGETDWTRLLETIASAPEVEEEPHTMAPMPVSAAPPPPPAAASSSFDPTPPVETSVMAEPLIQHEPWMAPEPEPVPARAPKRSNADNILRLAVGFGAAACVLLAAVLYEGGHLLNAHPVASASARATASASTSVHASVKASATVRPSAKPVVIPSATQPPATVLYVLGNGVSGNTVFRIRPGTAIAGYTRLVFDMHGAGMPSMVITQIDATHLQVIFKKTTVGNVPVSGIRSYQVAAVEPGVQSGPDGSFVIDLNRAVRVTAFTLPATGGYPWRLVVDLHTV